MKDLQSIIDKRAEVKLRNEIMGIDNVLYNTNYKLLKDIIVTVLAGDGKERKISLASIINLEYYGQAVYDKHIERYKEEEAKNFLEEIESLKQRVSQLGDEINYLQ